MDLAIRVQEINIDPLPPPPRPTSWALPEEIFVTRVLSFSAKVTPGTWIIPFPTYKQIHSFLYETKTVE